MHNSMVVVDLYPANDRQGRTESACVWRGTGGGAQSMFEKDGTWLSKCNRRPVDRRLLLREDIGL